MLLGQESIRDVILFPQLRPKDVPTHSSQSADQE
jgi:aspartyl-tRNA synthetase